MLVGMRWADVLKLARTPVPMLGVTVGMLALFLVGGAVWKDRSLFGPTVAAWVQALGSIAAILIAVWVPIYMRSIEERSQVERNLLRCVYAAGHLNSGWQALQQILVSGDFHEGTPGNIAVNVIKARKLLDGVDASILSPGSFALLHRCELSAENLSNVTDKLSKEKQPHRFVTLIPFEYQKTSLSEAENSLLKLKPVRIHGHWMLSDVPDDLWMEPGES